MNIKTKIVLLLFFSTLFKSYAQQNLFNVPSLEVTVKKDGFFQYQVNINNRIGNNLTYDYGLGKGWEIGFNVLNLSLNPNPNCQIIDVNNDVDSDQPLGPLVLINAQKEFEIGKIFKVSSGFQFGTNTSSDIDIGNRPAAFGYINTKFFLLDKKLQIINGIYTGNKLYLGKGSQIGVMNGVEYTLHRHVHVMVDIFWGDNYISECVGGFVFYLAPHISLSAGYQIPSPQSRAGQAVVFELTFF